jgi:hypothetical protein
MRISRTGGEVQSTRPQRADAHAGLARQPAVGRSHERRRLLVPGQDELDLRAAQRLDHGEVLFTRDAEDAVDAFVLQRRSQKVGGFAHDAFLNA